jgi:phage baseplate assembly protein gpV
MMMQSTDMPWQWNQRSMFNANGMSTINSVRITGISVTGSDEVTVNLWCDGSKTSPAVTEIAITNPIAMQGSIAMSSGMMGMGGMGICKVASTE